jgi:hypothetical protein
VLKFVWEDSQGGLSPYRDRPARLCFPDFRILPNPKLERGPAPMSLSQGRCILVSLVLVAASTAWGTEGTGQADLRSEQSLERATAAWSKRQRETICFDFTWTGEEFRSKDFEKLLHPAALYPNLPPEPRRVEGGHFPTKARFVLDSKGRLRNDIQDSTWSLKEEKYIPQTEVNVFDGSETRSFNSGDDFPSANEKREKVKWIGRDVQLLPIQIVYRPFVDKTIGVFRSPDALALTANQGVVDGRACLVLASGNRTVWVDPTRDYIPLRYYETEKGVTSTSLEIACVADPQHSWVPTAWKYADFSPNGELLRSIDAKVERYSINQPVPEDAFTIEYPVGTFVSNFSTNEHYIVKEGGGRRPVRKGEFDGSNYEKLRNSEPPAPPIRSRPRSLLLVNVALLLAVLAVALLYWRIVRKRSRRTERLP